jgi:hypothetical protein
MWFSRTVITFVLRLTSCNAAIVRVTAGGGTDPTYQFADGSGSSVATFTADVTNGKITASGVIEASDVQITSGASLNGKMDAIAIDSTPHVNSHNLVTSNGVYNAVAAKMPYNYLNKRCNGDCVNGETMWSWNIGNTISIVSERIIGCCWQTPTGVSLGPSATSWSSLSDERVKGNWGIFDNATDKLQQLTKLGTFEWVSGPGHEAAHTTNQADAPRQVGLSAQEIQNILPEAVTV